MSPLTEVGAGVHVLRYPVLDINVTLVTGGHTALLVDTLSTPAQANTLLAAVRRITDAPLLVVNTHHHFDHCFGNATIDPVAIHAHPEAAARMAATDPVEVHAAWGRHDPELSALREVTLRLPDHLVAHDRNVDLGDRVVELRFLGRGHTAGDLVVYVPDAGVVIAGDLVERGAPPQFGDGYPLQWPDTVAALLRLDAPVIVPGHGEVCGPDFVRGQHEELTALDWLIREGHADDAPADVVAARAPYDAKTSAIAVARGYRELTGTA